MLKLFIESWMIQSWDWRLFYGMAISFFGFLIYEFTKMAIISYRIKRLEAKMASDIGYKLDEMYKKINAGIEVKPSKYLQ